MKTPTPRWDEKRKRWQLNAQKDHVRRGFYSSIEGKKGEKEALRKCRIWLEGKTDLSEIRLEKAFDLFLIDLKARKKSDAWQNQCAKIGKNHIKSKLNAKKVYAISEQDWQDCITYAKPGLSQKTLKDIRGVITAFCKFAKKSRMIEEIPEDLEIPDAPTKGKTILQPDQVKQLFEPSDEWFINAWRFMAVTGLRPGECYGTRNDDIKNGVLTIQRSVSENRTITKGKNKNANRQIKLHAIAQEIISEQRMKVMHLNSPWTFCDATGAVGHPKVIYEHFRRWARPKGIRAAPYCLRHTFVSMTKNELPPELVKRLVGHSETMDTFGTYGHNVDGELDRAAAMLDNVFRNTLLEHTQTEI